MDLGTIKSKLDRAEYISIFDFDKDMRLVWNNAKKFNMPGSSIYKSAGFLRREWDQIFRRIKKDPVALEIWAKKARRSKPKRSPRDSLTSRKNIGHTRKEERYKVTNSNSKRQQLKQHDGEASSSSKPPDSKRLISGILTGNPVIGCSKEKTVPISPLILYHQETLELRTL